MPKVRSGSVLRKIFVSFFDMVRHDKYRLKETDFYPVRQRKILVQIKVPTPCISGIELKIMDFNTRCVIVKCGQIIINTTISRKAAAVDFCRHQMKII